MAAALHASAAKTNDFIIAMRVQDRESEEGSKILLNATDAFLTLNLHLFKTGSTLPSITHVILIKFCSGTLVFAGCCRNEVSGSLAKSHLGNGSPCPFWILAMAVDLKLQGAFQPSLEGLEP